MIGGKLLTMSDKAYMPLTPEQTNILRHCKNAFCNAVKAKFDCTAVFHNMKESASFASATSDVSGPEMRYSTTLLSGVEVSVWKDDLTRHKVDAVVNAANEMLNHGGGLALALSNAGGPMIQKMSDQVIEKYGKVPTGYAVVTTSGNLPCNRIIHAVGPCLNPNPSLQEIDYSKPLLHHAITNILKTVITENFQSVAIPALSSGLFNFPRPLCAEIIVKTIKQFDDCNAFPDRNLKIHLVNNDEPTVQEMERASMQILGMSNTSGSYSGAVEGRNQSTTFSSSNSFKFGNITLHLKKGFIEEEKVDVIVNTIAKGCNLSQGEISNAILMKAGRKIQEEIYRKKKLSSDCEIYGTKGYNLNCAAVYHTVCAFRSDPKSTEILHRVVIECLKNAIQVYKSISFPAIGTGNLGFNKYEVAQIMMNAVAAFAKQNMEKKLDINFVVFPKDDEIMKAFEKEMISMNGGLKSSGLDHDMPKSSAFVTKETTTNEIPTIELSSVSDEAKREAKTWTLHMLSQKNESLTIKNNLVVYLGQRDHENLLALQAKFGVHIKETFRSGNGGIIISGSPAAVSCVGFEVESMLCKAQEDFALAEENDMLYSVVRWQCEDVPWLQTPEISAALEKAYLSGEGSLVLNDHSIKVNFKLKNLVDNRGKTSTVKRTCLLMDYNYLDRVGNSFYARTPVTSRDYVNKKTRAFKDCGLFLVKVEKMENIALQQLFEMNWKRLNDKPKQLYQCVSAQFCDLICRVGFQKEFAPPRVQQYGSGIYFSSTLEEALRLWKGQFIEEQYIYIIQAQVLTGLSTHGSPDLILPPALAGDPLDRYDSITNSSKQTHVIFSGQQALPEYLFICQK